jgi:hypothetical protein
VKDNIALFEAGINIHTMPKTFQDAVKVTRALGISYIWIDSLCIVQDSSEDWLKESQQMESVYSNSYCNIAATKSADSDGGLFSELPQYFPVPVIIDGKDIESSNPDSMRVKPVTDDPQSQPRNKTKDSDPHYKLKKVASTPISSVGLHDPDDALVLFSNPFGPFWISVWKLWEEEIRYSILLSRTWGIPRTLSRSTHLTFRQESDPFRVSPRLHC